MSSSSTWHLCGWIERIPGDTRQNVTVRKPGVWGGCGRDIDVVLGELSRFLVSQKIAMFFLWIVWIWIYVMLGWPECHRHGRRKLRLTTRFMNWARVGRNQGHQRLYRRRQ